MSYAETFYTTEERQRLWGEFYWSRTASLWRLNERGRTASLWRLNKRGRTTVYADPVLEGPRRWFLDYTHKNGSYAGEQHTSPPFGQLEPLLLWAKLEGLL